MDILFSIIYAYTLIVMFLLVFNVGNAIFELAYRNPFFREVINDFMGESYKVRRKDGVR